MTKTWRVTVTNSSKKITKCIFSDKTIHEVIDYFLNKLNDDYPLRFYFSLSKILSAGVFATCELVELGMQCDFNKQFVSHDLYHGDIKIVDLHGFKFANRLIEIEEVQ